MCVLFENSCINYIWYSAANNMKFNTPCHCKKKRERERQREKEEGKKPHRNNKTDQKKGYS